MMQVVRTFSILSTLFGQRQLSVFQWSINRSRTQFVDGNLCARCCSIMNIDLRYPDLHFDYCKLQADLHVEKATWYQPVPRYLLNMGKLGSPCNVTL